MFWNEFSLVGGEFCLLTFACIALLYDAFSDVEKNSGTFMIALIGLAGAFLINVKIGLPYFAAEGGEAVSHTIFNAMLRIDPLAVLGKCATCLVTAGVFVYARQYINERAIPQGEFYVMCLFALIGMHTMISANHFLSLYLGLELLSLPLYAMVAMRRDQSATSEAAIKYFVMGALASGLLLYGISLIYGMTGAMDYATVHDAIRDSQNTTLILFGLVFVITGAAFKLGAVPFHMWLPDVYQGAPAAVTAFIATAPKIAALIMLMRMLVSAMPELILDWQQLLIILSIASMALGNLVAMLQTNFKRLLAYSAIAHVGYLLLGIISGTEAGYTASLFYIMIYAMMSLGAFGMITLLSQNGIEFEWIDDLKGLNSRHPWLAFMLLLFIFSMAGIPPTVGFFAKLSVLQALISAKMTWLAVVALVFAVFGAFYYIRIIKMMYFEEPDTDTTITAPTSSMILVSVNGMAMILFGVMPGLLYYFCHIALRGL